MNDFLTTLFGGDPQPDLPSVNPNTVLINENIKVSQDALAAANAARGATLWTFLFLLLALALATWLLFRQLQALGKAVAGAHEEAQQAHTEAKAARAAVEEGREAGTTHRGESGAICPGGTGEEFGGGSAGGRAGGNDYREGGEV